MFNFLKLQNYRANSRPFIYLNGNDVIFTKLIVERRPVNA